MNVKRGTLSIKGEDNEDGQVDSRGEWDNVGIGDKGKKVEAVRTERDSTSTEKHNAFQQMRSDDLVGGEREGFRNGGVNQQDKSDQR